MKIKKIAFSITFFVVGINLCFAQNTNSEKEKVEINNKNIKSGTYTSKTNIQAAGSVKKGTKGVVFKAEEGITLKSGFSSEAGSDVILKIGEVEDKKETMEPKGEKLFKHSIQISPNPFKYSTTVSYSLPQKETTSISIYDAKDKLVKQLFKEEKRQGMHELEFDRSNLNSGVYKVVLKTVDAILVQKMIIIQ